MDDCVQRRREIDEKLHRESANLSRLRDALQRSDQITENMVGILTTFEGRLQKLENTIKPIYKETDSLKICQDNIDKTLHCLDEVIAYYHVAKETEGTIKENPSKDIDNYLSSMDKLDRAVQYFEQNHPGSPELSAVKNVFEKGKKSLEREFHEILSRHSRPVPPVVVTDMLQEDDGSRLMDHLSEDVINDLLDIAKWLASKDSRDFTSAYNNVRSNMLLKSITGVKDHIKSTSSSGAGTPGGGAYSPSMPRKFGSTPQGTPSKRNSSLKKITFSGKATAMLKKYSQQLVDTTMGQGHKRQSSLGIESVIDEGSYVDVEVYINTVSAIQKLLQSERALLEQIIPEKLRRKTFDTLILATIDSMNQEGEQLAATVKRSTNKKDFSGVISLLPVVRHLRSVKTDFERVLEGCQQTTRTKLVSLISNLNSTGARALEDFIEFIRNDPDKAWNIPKDGTVHELTSNTLIFLEQMLEYIDAAGGMLMTQDPTAIAGQQDPKKNKKKLSEYIVRVLSTLRLNLTNKASAYSDMYLGAIFMMNNANYILQSLRKTELLNLANLVSTNAAEVYEEEIRESKRQYMVSFSKVIPHIVEHYADSSIPLQRAAHVLGPTMKLTEKDRQNIKDKFSGFNKEIEELFKVQKGYAIPDANLRKQLKHDNGEYILPKYKIFLNKYKSSQFTKNTQKYIKYTENDVKELLERFFDASA